MTTQAHLLTRQALIDEELEAHIVDCGKRLAKAHAEGDTAAAREWLSLETEAIAARSPAQVRRMEECYFSAEGERARREAYLRSVS